MAGLAKMLYSPKIEEILAELEDYGGTTLGELLAFMHAYNLRFAAANSFRQRRIYMKLYPLLLEQANGRIGSPRQSGSPGSRRGRVGRQPGSGSRREHGIEGRFRTQVRRSRFLQGNGLETPERPSQTGSAAR